VLRAPARTWHPRPVPPSAARRTGHAARELAHGVLDLVLPRPCPGCGGPGPWCGSCAATLSGRPTAVRLSDATIDALRDGPPPGRGGRAGDGIGRVTVPPVFALTRYRGPARGAIIAGKERNRRDLPPALGAALGAGVLRLLDAGVITRPVRGDLWLVPAPSRCAAARARGGDPVTAMASAAARFLAAAGRPTGVAPCLRTGHAAADSVGLDAAARIANLANRIRFVPAGAPPPGAGVVLVDDVLTTGATVASALRVLATKQVRVHGVVVVASVPGPRSAHG
jgi:predicted amidophosphoribosyltransferase